MARIKLTADQVEKSQTKLAEKLAEHDDALDAAEAGGLSLLKKTLTIAATDFDALGDTDTSQAVDIDTDLPTNAQLLGVNVRLTTPFTGGGNGSVSVDVGSAGDADAIVDGADLFAAAVDGQASAVPPGIAPFKRFAGATQLVATFTADVGLKELTAGAAVIDVLYTVL